MKSLISKSAVFCFSFFLSAALLYTGYAFYSCSVMYRSIKQNRRGWHGRVHRCDGRLGFAPIPGAAGAHVFPIGPDVPMRYSREGFRVPVEKDLESGRRPCFLFLGGSYTYGDACRAEETFPYLVGKHFGGAALNAGVCGYGLAQIYLLARDLLPRYRPDFVIVQYSDWLINRATREFSPTYFFKIPYPYFTENQNTLTIVPPVYRTALFDYDISQLRENPPGVSDYLRFISRAALPLQVHEDARFLLFCLKKLSGMIPQPVPDRQKVVDFVYGNISDLCARHGARMLVVGIRQQSYRMDASWEYVNADKGLHEGLQSDKDYDRLYSHWRGNPPVKVDNHPNAHAHRIIAEQLIEKITPLVR